MARRHDHKTELHHGTAQTPTHEALKARGFGPGGRLSFGYARPDPHSPNPQEVTYNGVKHVNLIAANRTHKTTTLIRQALLHSGSMMVVDIRGEVCAATYHYRKNVLKQDVILIDPADMIASKLGVKPDSINLMDLIDAESATFLERSVTLADGFIIPASNGHDRFWNATALDGFSTSIMGAKVDPDNDPATLTDAVRLFNESTNGFNEMMHGVFEDLEAAKAGTNLNFSKPGMKNSPNRLVREGANRLLGAEERTRSNIASTVRSNTWILGSDLIRNSFGKATASLEGLPDGNLSVYIIIPTHLIRHYKNMVRVLKTMAMDVVSSSQRFPDPSVLYLWDECAVCGRSDQLLDSYALQAGDGNQIISVWHDIAQMKRIYPEYETFLNNAGMNILFSSNDKTTLEYFAHMSGITDVLKMSDETARSRVSPFTPSDHRRSGDMVSSRALITPDRLKNMPPYEVAFYPANMSPFFGFKAPYYLDKKFRDSKGQPLYDVPARYRDLPPPPALDFTSNGKRLEPQLEKLIPSG